MLNCQDYHMVKIPYFLRETFETIWKNFEALGYNPEASEAGSGNCKYSWHKYAATKRNRNNYAINNGIK